jgi:putative (di)nucleoside polyphosphate hydrolase
MVNPNFTRLGCGTLIFNERHELLLCHVTGQAHWDLPKGGANAGESPLQAALRETREETGLQLRPQALLDLGRFAYQPAQQLHLFAAWMPRLDLTRLICTSHFTDRLTGRRLPEMDGYRWQCFSEIARHCTPALAAVLTCGIDLAALWRQLSLPMEAAEAA